MLLSILKLQYYILNSTYYMLHAPFYILHTTYLYWCISLVVQCKGITLLNTDKTFSQKK